MTRDSIAATAAFIAIAFATPSLAQSAMTQQQGGCWKATDSTKPYGYMGSCPAPERQATRRPARIDEKGTQSNAMQVSMQGGPGPGQCWKGTDSVKLYGYYQACR